MWEELQTAPRAVLRPDRLERDRFNLSPGGEARYAEGLYVSGDFFRVLGVQPIIGRAFTAEDDRPGCASPGAVVSYAFWSRELGGDPGALGRTLSLDGRRVAGDRRHAAGVLRRRGREPLRRGDPALRGQSEAPRFAHGMVALGDGPAEAGLDRSSAPTRTCKSISPAFMQATMPPTYRADFAKKFLANKLAVTRGRDRAFRACAASMKSRSGCCSPPPDWCC